MTDALADVERYGERHYEAALHRIRRRVASAASDGSVNRRRDRVPPP
ncbi:MAG: hypothetical protein AB7R67_04870 [Vicinamibacterales bacterium]